MIKTTLELYNKLCNDAGLNIKDDFYDAEFNKQLFNALAINSKEELGKITIELFVEAFFNALYPYSLMMSEILEFYEEAESKSNGKNIKVSFNFEELDSKLNFDINKFKEYYEVLNKTTIKYSKHITVNDLEIIDELFRYVTSLNEINVENLETWPKELVIENVHDIQDSETKQIVLRLNQIINDILKYVREESNSYGEFISAFSERVSSDSLLKTSNIEILTSSLTGMISDKILGYVFNGLNNSVINGSIYDFKDKLKEIFKLDRTYDEEEYIKSFEEYLSLPIWKARHEIYSVWVSTKIKEATNHLNPQINTTAGKLEYGFKAYKLISFDTLPVKIDLYSELKLPHDKNISNKRDKYVQPDYTLVRKRANPLNEDAILVVECKQYKKSSKKNFTEAVVDYANAHPKAHIFLVNYGNITQSVLNTIQKHNIQQTRYTLIDHFEPTNNTSLKLFTDKVKNQLYGYYLKPNTIYIELSWNNNFEDLDLELEFEVNKTKHYINYGCKKYPIIENPTIEMNIKLNKDVIRNGINHDLNDKEIIEIKNFKDYDYRVRVTKFSNEENFHESDAVVVIRDNNRVYKKLEITKNDIIEDSVWNVFSFKNIEDLLTKMI